MGLFDKLFGSKRAGPTVTRWPGGTAIIDFRNAALAANDAMAAGDAVKRQLELASKELDYINGVLRYL
jgi:hypothetical protein